MVQGEIKLSTLRCEPYFADNSDCSEKLYELDFPFELILWRVFVDDIVMSSGTLPFQQSDQHIELSANKCLPYFGDGGQYVTARSFDQKLIWFGFDTSRTVGDLLPFDMIYVFDAEAYVQAIREAYSAHAQLEHIKESSPSLLKQFLNYLSELVSFDAKSSVSSTSTKTTIQLMPKLSEQELKSILLRSLRYDFDLPLYRMPELADDPRGARLYRAVWDTISLQAIWVSEPPPNPIEVRIGLDKDVFVESIWQVGKIGDDVAVLFVSEPHFPLWLTGFKSIAPLLEGAL